MKKYYRILIIFVLVFYCGISVKADVIWEPEDPFFRKHSEECKYYNRTCTANGPDGKVIVYKSPMSSKVITELKNGEAVHVYWVYQAENGVSWGSFEDEESGWMPMDYLTPVYDSISFSEEYSSEIESQDGTLDAAYQGKEIYIWQYPGSEDVWSFEISDEMNLPEYSRIYRDEEGRCWGNLNYYYGYKDVWICIDEPSRGLSDLYPDGAPYHEASLEERDFSGQERIVPVQDDAFVIWAAIAVCLTALVTVVLLALLKRKMIKNETE